MVMEKYQNKYRIPSNRRHGFDYGSDGFYFVTICTQNRVPYFGTVVETDQDPSLIHTAVGRMAVECWNEIPQHNAYIILGPFVVMPDHVHGILRIQRNKHREWKPNTFGPQSDNLGHVIRSFKGAVKRWANKNGVPFEWQARYHDRIIYDVDQLIAVGEYIRLNPAKWLEKNRDGL
jgi:REP element-mobilizing transposase RayT